MKYSYTKTPFKYAIDFITKCEKAKSVTKKFIEEYFNKISDDEKNELYVELKIYRNIIINQVISGYTSNLSNETLEFILDTVRSILNIEIPKSPDIDSEFGEI